MRRSLAVLCAVTLGATALATSAPATAAPAPAAHEAAHAAVADELLVGYVEGASASDRTRARSRASAQRQETLVTAAADRNEVELVRIPQGSDRGRAIAALQSDPAVAYAEPNYTLTRQATASDPFYTSSVVANDLWGMYGDGTSPANQFGSQAGEAWAAGRTGSSAVTIGVIDEGIKTEHPDLSGQVNNAGETANGFDDDGNRYVDDVHGWDFVNNDNTVYDGGAAGAEDNHGTHVAGTIGAKSNSVGVVGVNWQVTLLSGKFLGPSGGSLANAVKAVDYFTGLPSSRNVVATNNSWGGGGYSTSLHHAIVRAAKADVLFIAAAGNGGTNNDRQASYPANYSSTGCPAKVRCATPAGGWAGYDNVIAVAAIDRMGALAGFSQYGLQTVDLGAPGVGVWSTTADALYSKYSGTSMATPHVSGGAALYAASNPTANAATIKAAILSSAVPTASLNGKTVTGGRLNVSGF